MKNKISIITPFYYGNKYINRLLNSVNQCITQNEDKALFEILIINDSPTEKVHISESFKNMDIKVISNEKNVGIQKTRINGLKYATGEWILFLDQDDELICEGFSRQILLTEKCDVVIGNGIYQFEKENKKIFHTQKEMNYLIQLRRFIQIRNLIPSPGECLIRKSSIPELWTSETLEKNGSDDWFLWILLFKNNIQIQCNPELVYVHNNTGGNNLSSDLEKMKNSSEQMYEILKKNNCLTKKEEKELKEAITFKYLQDTRRLKLTDLWKYRKTIGFNISYKIWVELYRHVR